MNGCFSWTWSVKLLLPSFWKSPALSNFYGHKHWSYLWIKGNVAKKKKKGNVAIFISNSICLFFISLIPPPPLITMAGVCTQCWIDVIKGHNLSLILTLRKKCSFTVSPESTLLITDFYIYLFWGWEISFSS